MIGQGRWAVVAGGSGGLGRAICTSLAEDGWSIAVGYHSNEEAADLTVARVRELEVDAVPVRLDLSDPETSGDLIDVLGSHGAVPTAAVYAAGPTIPMGFISETPPGVFSRQIDLDLKACYNFLQPLLPAIRSNRGSICALVTPAIVRFARMDLLSSAPKSAVQNIIRGIAAEEGRYGVRANCVGVGVVKGDGLWTSLVASGHFTERGLQHALDAMPLGRFGTPQDVGAAVQFLVSQRAGWITGQTLNVDGGYSV